MKKRGQSKKPKKASYAKKVVRAAAAGGTFYGVVTLGGYGLGILATAFTKSFAAGKAA